MRLSFLPERLRRLRRQKDGNVAMIFALSAPVLCFGVAIAVDYTNATIVQSKLNAAADAAALAALTPAMLQQSNDVAKAAAVAMFNARAAAIGSLVVGQTNVTANINYASSNARMRVVTISYTAENNTIFSGVLNLAYMNISGSSTAQASVPPNIDFYLLLDNSPSMQLPADATGIATMQGLTPTQDGGNACAFACHQASTNNGDTQGNPCSDGSTPTVAGYVGNNLVANQYCASTNAQGQSITQIDNFALARKNNITLRLDELSAGVTSLMQTAYNYQTSGMWASPPTYRFAAYEMDQPWTVGTTNNLLMGLTGSYTSAWSAASANFGVMEMYANNSACANSACSSGVSFSDTATNFDVAMSDINANMPNPGNGTNQTGDKPQEVLFFVTDGVEDENLLGNRLIQTINGGASTNYCTTMKNRGIKIAILYTEYLQVPANAFYESYVAPIQPNIASALQACASQDLFIDAKIGDNLGQDLAQLFQLVTQSAALSN